MLADPNIELFLKQSAVIEHICSNYCIQKKMSFIFLCAIALGVVFMKNKLIYMSVKLTHPRTHEMDNVHFGKAASAPIKLI